MLCTFDIHIVHIENTLHIRPEQFSINQSLAEKILINVDEATAQIYDIQ